MARFQLLVSEPDKAPRVAPLDKSIVLGRSSRADVVVADEEVSREQLQILVDGDALALTSLGATNPTIVDGRTIAPGTKTALRIGSSILAGRTRIEVQRAAAADVGEATIPQTAKAAFAAPTESLRPAPGGARPPALSAAAPASAPPPPRPTPPPPPAAPPPPPTEPANFDGTIQLPPRARPPAGPAAPPTPAAAAPTPPPTDAANLDGTIQLPPRARPPAGPAAPLTPAAAAPTPPPTDAANLDGTIQLPLRARPPAGPAAPPTPAAAAPTPPAAPPDRPAPPIGKPATAPPAPAANTPARPSTVALAVAANAPPIGATLPTAIAPRLVVRGATLRRVVRLSANPSRIGRDEHLEVVLPDESVSGVHAEIRFDGGRWLAVDRDSRNGTVADGEVLRGQSRPIGRNAILAFGTVRAVFLVDDPVNKAADRRREARALQSLVRQARLTAAEARQVLDRQRHDDRSSIPEIVLRDTAVDVVMWSEAITAAAQPTWFDRLCALFRRRPAPPPQPPQPPPPQP
ncbi:MAG: FHA domain-containing protein [Phycisphaerales bacterium]|nr:FHA domain-containing protein [Phycisphaerales bacterium]